jgi:hypothetical protein
MMSSTQKKLSSLATLFEKTQSKGDCLFPRVFLFESEFDLFQNKVNVYRAIEKWKSIHPLLNARLVVKKTENNDMPILYYDFNQKFDTEVNVNFLRFDSNENDCWKYIIEYEQSRPFQSQTGPLWRLHFIELNAHHYALVSNTHHAITDGKNSFVIHQELFKIIEDFFIFAESIAKNQEIEFEYGLSSDPRFTDLPNSIKLHIKDNPQSDLFIPELLKPNSLNVSITRQGKFFKQNGEVFVTVEEITKNRSRSLSQFEIIHISSEEFTELMLKCKKNDVKLTGCLETLLTLGFYEALKKHANDDLFEYDLRYHTTINTRPYLNPKLEFSTMGVWIAGIEPLIKLNKEINVDNFWSIANENSFRLHEYIKQRGFFSKKDQEEEEKYYQKVLRGFTVKDVHNMFVFTNIGKVDSYARSSKGKIKLLEFYSTESFVLESDFCSAFTSCCSIDGRLYWGFSYNRILFKESFIKDWIFFIQSIVTRLVSCKLK